MIHEDIQLSGSLQISGSFALPLAVNTASISNPLTGSIIIDQSDNNKTKIYNGNEWKEIASQGVAVADIEYLVVAGGGGGGEGYYGGGGGAGGLLSSSLSSVESGSTFTVTIGSGGSGGNSQTVDGGNGVDSSIAGASISTITTTGGGGGASRNSDPGADGGSGGGAALPSNSGGSGTVGQGNDGGTLPAEKYGAGGGGASQAGQVPPGVYSGSPQNDSLGAPGGSGSYSSITGTSTPYAGGGGGGARTTYSSNGIDGGPGGGGAGGAYVAGTAGTANTGGGGGGGGNNGDDGGAGGSGVVILAYDSGSINAVGGLTGDAGNDRKYHQFNQSGTFKAGSTSDFGIVTDSLVSHYDAGNFASRGTSTWTDLQGNYNGTAAGDPTLTNFYYDFDGTGDYFNLGYSTNYTEFTVEAWVNSDNAGLADYQSIIGKWWDGTNRGFALYMISNTFRVIIAYTDANSDHIFDHGTTSTSTWHHVVFGWKNQEGYIFSADNSVTTASISKDIRTNTQNWLIGEQDYRVLKEWDGKIAQVRIYNKKLTSNEISQNYNATKTNFV